MVSSAVISRGPSAADLSTLNLNIPSPVPVSPAVPSLTPGREAQLVRRIRELEDEVRVVRAEQEKQVRDKQSVTQHGSFTYPFLSFRKL